MSVCFKHFSALSKNPLLAQDIAFNSQYVVSKLIMNEQCSNTCMLACVLLLLTMTSMCATQRADHTSMCNHNTHTHASQHKSFRTLVCNIKFYTYTLSRTDYVSLWHCTGTSQVYYGAFKGCNDIVIRVISPGQIASIKRPLLHCGRMGIHFYLI